MKKTIALLLLAVCLLIAGCGAAPVDPNSVIAPDIATTAPVIETTFADEYDWEEDFLIEQEEEFLEEEEEIIEDDYYEEEEEDDEEAAEDETAA